MSKKLIKTLVELNKIFVDSFSGESLFQFFKIEYDGMFNLEKEENKQCSILDINLTDIAGAQIITRNHNWNTDNELYDIQESDLLNSVNFEKDFPYLQRFCSDLMKNKSFMSLCNYYVDVPYVLSRNTVIAKNLNNYIKNCDREQITFLDRIGFNPLFLSNDSPEYLELIKIFEEKMDEPYVVSFLDKKVVEMNYLPENITNIYSKSFHLFEENSKFKEQMNEYIMEGKVFRKYMTPEKKSLNGQNVVELNDYEKITFKISTKNGKAIVDKKPIRYIFRAFNTAMNKNNVDAFFGCEVDKKEVSLDFFIEKSLSATYGDSLRTEVRNLVVELMNTRKETYQVDWADMENKYKNSFDFLNRNKKEDVIIKKSKKRN